MRGIDAWFDRFCHRHPKLAIPGLMRFIILGNALVYMLDMFSRGACSTLLSFAPSLIIRGEVWRLLTFIFVPQYYGNIFFLILSLYFYYAVGSVLEREWGSTKFTVYYAFGVLLNIVAGLILAVFYPNSVTANMIYVNQSMFFAFATLYPDAQLILLIFPVKAKWLARIYAALLGLSIVYSLFVLDFLSVVIPIIAIFNYLCFFSSDIARMLTRGARRPTRRTVDFKEAGRQVRAEKGYLHKCAVCGKTDVTHPELEFRYCSKCNGYYCYCADHIGSHVHIE